MYHKGKKACTYKLVPSSIPFSHTYSLMFLNLQGEMRTYEVLSLMFSFQGSSVTI
jgi:hypothetical protein